MFCSKCGNKSPSGARFCQKCGNKIDNNNESAHLLTHPDPASLVALNEDSASYAEQAPAMAGHDTSKIKHTNNTDFMSYNVVPNPTADNKPASHHNHKPNYYKHRTHMAAPTQSGDMDYTFYPGQTPEPEPDESTDTDNTGLIDYPIQPVFPKPVAPSRWAITDANLMKLQEPQLAPEPLPGQAPYSTDVTDFSGYQILPAAYKPATPTSENMTNGHTPIYQKPQNAELPQMLQQLQPQQQLQQQQLQSPVMTAPPPAEYVPHQEEMWHSHEESGDMITHMPGKKSKLPIIISVVAVLIIGAVVAVFLFNRIGRVNPDHLIGTWEQSPPLGTWIPRFEFNEDGTGMFFQFNTEHITIRNAVEFTWEISSGNMMRSSLWPEMAEVSMQRRSSPPRFSFRMEGSNEWQAFVQVVTQ